MTDLPPGWAQTTLGEILLRIEAGKSFACEPRRANADEWGIIKVSAMTWGRFREEENKAVPPGVAFDPAYEIKPGDILVSRANTQEYVGAPVLVGSCRPRLLLSDKSLRLVPSPHIDRRWLALLLSSPFVREEISRRATGTKDSMRNISQDSLRDICVWVPALAEQQKIVASLEEYFSRLDGAIELAENGKTRAAVLRRKILDDADFQLTDTPRKRIVELLREPLRNGYSARATQDGLGIRTLTLTAVTDKEFTEKNTKIAAADPDRVRHLWLHPGDIFVQRSNTPELVGSSAIYSGPEGWAIFPDLLIRVRVSSLLLPEFAYLMLSTSRVRSYLRSSAKGLAGSMPKIDQGVIERIEIPVPSLDFQQEFVEYVKTRQEGVSRLLDGLKGVRSQSGYLRRSLLREAFAGRLLPQDPADEPASELLARIKAERAAQAKPKRARRTTPKESPTATRTEWPDAGRTPMNYEQEGLL
ncbi:hypothetical protein ACIBF6_21260 [Streptosporangium amethystogenes]|uniref:hypothetical protein n=1 Tax=Streptosporangium amethystogenes TaxID=2002 RepID=UPI00379A1BB2